VLLTRAMLGAGVYSVDRRTNTFLHDRISPATGARAGS
jgi:hypothetical protein